VSGVLLAVRTPGSPAFGEDDLELVSTFADQARWRCSAPKAVRRTRTAGVRRSGPDRPGSARARHRAVVRDRPDSARHSANWRSPGRWPRGSPSTSSTSTRSSPRSPSVAITVRIGIVPAELALHAQAVLREAVSNTVCDTPTPPSSPWPSPSATRAMPRTGNPPPTAHRRYPLILHDCPVAMGMRRRGMW